ncbi:MAG: NAD-dependent epimerase/dehydratase family protein [Halapricum sp.]
MAELEGKQVLVTGGAGFIGSHIADALVGDNDVTVLDDLSSGRRENVPEEATFIEGDVRDAAALADAGEADVIFHEAAVVSVAESVENPQDCHAVTTDGTIQVLEFARQHDARVVLASSAAIYGDPESVPITEDAPKKPSSPYGVDKLTADHYTRLYAALYGLPTVALRYFNVYGPGQTAGDYSGVISIFREQALAGDPLTVHGDGDQTRDFVHVEDVVRANLAAATTDATGEAYHIGTGTETSVLELAETVREVADSDSAIVHVAAREGDIDRSLADVSKAREQLEYEPSMDLTTGLATLF